MKPKEYPSDCSVGGPNRRPIILVTHDESIFHANDGKRQAWIEENKAFLRPKSKGKGIMLSDFLLPWTRLSLESLPEDKHTGLNLPMFTTKFFEYGKNGGYWEADDMIEHTISTAISIFNTLYPGYEALFLFDNSAGHAAFTSDALRVQHMNLNPGGQQNVLRPGLFGDPQVVQSMVDHDSVPKGIKRVLEERGLWNDGLRLECLKPLCEICESVKKCTSCKKRSKCDQC